MKCAAPLPLRSSTHDEKGEIDWHEHGNQLSAYKGSAPTLMSDLSLSVQMRMNNQIIHKRCLIPPTYLHGLDLVRDVVICVGDVNIDFTIYISLPSTLLYHMHYVTIGFTLPYALRYHRLYFTICITLPSALLYHMHYVTFYFTLPYALRYHRLYFTICITLPSTLLYHMHYVTIGFTLPYALRYHRLYFTICITLP